jgi:hypothetical protein
MPRRDTPQINAGSMADIAFLLLVFFLMVTQIATEEGILRQLPPPVPPDFEAPDVKQKDVFVVLVNAQDELLVEGEFMKLQNLKAAAKEFLICNGVFKDLPVKEDFPERKWVRKAEVKQKLAEADALIATAPTDDHRKSYEKTKEKLQRKLDAIEYFGGEFKELPGSALISMKNHNQTGYDMYIQVQNELQSAINELRDELCEKHFGMTYNALYDEYERKKNDDDEAAVEELQSRVYAVWAVYPQRISEAEPEKSVVY